MSLEEKVIEGGFYYIHSFNHDAVGRKLVVEFIKAPEESSSDTRVLTFTNLEDFLEEVDWDEVKAAEAELTAGIIDSLIGLDEYPDGETVEYVMHTEMREMIFRTKERPLIEDV